MMILKLPFKLFALLLLLVCATVRALVGIAGNFANIGISLLMLFVLGCGIYTACHGQWSQTLLLFMVEMGCMAVLMCTLYSEVILDKAMELLGDFIHS